MRPPVDRELLSKAGDVPEEVLNLMDECYAHVPEKCAFHALLLLRTSPPHSLGRRPNIFYVRRMVEHMAKGNINLLDHMLKHVEQYARTLESKTVELEEEQKRADTLLYRLLPR